MDGIEGTCAYDGPLPRHLVAQVAYAKLTNISDQLAGEVRIGAAIVTKVDVQSDRVYKVVRHFRWH